MPVHHDAQLIVRHLPVSGFGFKLSNFVLQFVHLTAHFVELLMILRLKQLIALELEFLDFVLQVRLGVNDLVCKMRVRLFDAESFRDFVHQLFFILPVHAFDLWKLQRFLTQFEDGHFLQVSPFHKNLRSSWLGSLIVWRMFTTKGGQIPSVLERKGTGISHTVAAVYEGVKKCPSVSERRIPLLAEEGNTPDSKFFTAP